MNRVWLGKVSLEQLCNVVSLPWNWQTGSEEGILVQGFSHFLVSGPLYVATQIIENPKELFMNNRLYLPIYHIYPLGNLP